MKMNRFIVRQTDEQVMLAVSHIDCHSKRALTIVIPLVVKLMVLSIVIPTQLYSMIVLCAWFSWEICETQYMQRMYWSIVVKCRCGTATNSYRNRYYMKGNMKKNDYIRCAVNHYIIIIIISCNNGLYRMIRTDALSNILL